MKAVTPSTQFITSQSLGGSFNSALIDCTQDDVAGIQLNYTGSPVGSVSIQGSIDGVNFATLSFNVGGTSTSSLALPGSASPIVLDLVSGSLIKLQVVYTFTSGSGTMDGFFTKKRLGD